MVRKVAEVAEAIRTGGAAQCSLQLVTLRALLGDEWVSTLAPVVDADGQHHFYENVGLAVKFADGQVSELVASLSKKFGQKLKPEVRVNPELIGGVRASVGDQVLDGSVRARLAEMQTALTA